jgi:hypothetical protein
LRISNIALDWMSRWAVAIPDSIKFDPRVISMWPQPEGPQHDEVASGFGYIPKWTGITWPKRTESFQALRRRSIARFTGDPIWRRSKCTTRSAGIDLRCVDTRRLEIVLRSSSALPGQIRADSNGHGGRTAAVPGCYLNVDFRFQLSNKREKSTFEKPF